MSWPAVPNLAQSSARSLSALAEEDRVVAELELLGITYLSRSDRARANSVRPLDQMLADLVRQSNARIREAVIAVLLLHPTTAGAVHAALRQLSPADQTTLRLFYTSAVLLQLKYANQLKSLGKDHQPLPDLFSEQLGLPSNGSAEQRLIALGQIHRRLSGRQVNWAGTYDNVAQQLIRRLQMELRWNQ